jgi:hypothetical protein
MLCGGVGSVLRWSFFVVLRVGTTHAYSKYIHCVNVIIHPWSIGRHRFINFFLLAFFGFSCLFFSFLNWLIDANHPLHITCFPASLVDMMCAESRCRT